MTRTALNTPLATATHPTQQQIFDTVVAHAAGMSEKSMRVVGTDPIAKTCGYRGENGARCFIGELLTDAEAAPLDSRTDSNFASLLDTEPHLIPDRLRHFMLRHFLTSLQRIHDACDQADWGDELLDFAQRNNLSPLAVDENFLAEKQSRNNVSEAA